MSKTFYTEHEIEDLFKSGVTRLEVNDTVVLTGLAYEKAMKLGMQLIQSNDQPSDAPVRPYITKSETPVASSLLHLQATTPDLGGKTPAPADLQARIKNAVIAKLGSSVDSAMLDSIIRRVLDQVKV